MNAPPKAIANKRTIPAIVNAMSVDVEDYYQVWALSSVVDRADWDDFPDRVEDNTRRVLALFAEFGVKATFFALGCVAARHPGLVRAIVDQGHELGSHGYAHHRIAEQDRRGFRDDVSRTKSLLEDISGRPVHGYRAASFSVTADTLWAYDVLAECGHLYSSSQHPIRHDHYGMPDAPRFPFRPEGARITEIPVATAQLLGRRLTCAGGGYFRLLPYRWSRALLRRVNRHDGRPATFYFHPWEIDPDQPRIAGIPAKSRFRHYTSLAGMEGKLRRLLSDFTWSRLDKVYARDIALSDAAGAGHALRAS